MSGALWALPYLQNRDEKNYLAELIHADTLVECFWKQGGRRQRRGVEYRRQFRQPLRTQGPLRGPAASDPGSLPGLGEPAELKSISKALAQTLPALRGSWGNLGLGHGSPQLGLEHGWPSPTG